MISDYFGGYRANERVFLELRSLPPPTSDIIDCLAPMKGEFFKTRQSCVERIRELSTRELSDAEAWSIARRMRRYRISRGLHALGVLRDRYVPPSGVLPGFWAFLSISPLVLFLRQRVRFYCFATLRRLRGQEIVQSVHNTNESGFTHNYRQILDFSWGHRNRTERIMNVLKTIGGYDFRNSRILCVGPRNESEILLLRAHGFRKRNIESIDLFSYSPRIRVMDMNDLDYEDDSFDVHYSSAVIKYSPDIRRTAAQAVRTTRNGGLMVFGFMYGMESDIIPDGSALAVGVRDLLKLFEGHVDHVYWHDEYMVAPDDIRAAIIFRLKKQPAGIEEL